jgi:hypothetical protein
MSDEELYNFFDNRFKVKINGQAILSSKAILLNIGITGCPRVYVSKDISDIVWGRPGYGIIKKTGRIFVEVDVIDSLLIIPRMIQIVFPKKFIVAEFNDFGYFKELRIAELDTKRTYRYYKSRDGH